MVDPDFTFPTTFQEHVKRMQTNTKRAHELYDDMGARFSVNPHAFLWRTRYRSIYLFAMMGLWLEQHPKNTQYSATIKEWREAFPAVGGLVTRNIVALGVMQKNFIAAEIEVACNKITPVSASSIKDVISLGVKLKLLNRENGHHYSLTDLCMQESFDRNLIKMLTPEIVEFCEFVAMFNTMRKQAEKIGEMEKSGILGRGNFSTVNEALYKGIYDDEIFGEPKIG
jgi:hypothetical protein